MAALTVVGTTVLAIGLVVLQQSREEKAKLDLANLKEDKSNPFIQRWDFYSSIYGCPTVQRTVESLSSMATEQQTIRPVICDNAPAFIISTKKNVFLVYNNAYIQMDRNNKKMVTVPDDDALATVINRNAIKATSW
jgi:hypothetical protein